MYRSLNSKSLYQKTNFYQLSQLKSISYSLPFSLYFKNLSLFPPQQQLLLLIQRYQLGSLLILPIHSLLVGRAAGSKLHSRSLGRQAVSFPRCSPTYEYACRVMTRWAKGSIFSFILEGVKQRKQILLTGCCSSSFLTKPWSTS